MNLGNLHRLTAGGDHFQSPIGDPTGSALSSALRGPNPTGPGSRNSMAIMAMILSAVLCGTAQAQFTVLHAFTGDDGNDPFGVSAKTGSLLYGVTGYGGEDGWGTVWIYDTISGTFLKLHDFPWYDDGGIPYDLATDGNVLFGTTTDGGANGDGTIWDFDAVGFDNRRDLNGPIDDAAARSVVYKDGHLYGLSYVDGAEGGGTLWSMNTTTADFDILHSLEPTDDGSNLIGRPVFSGDMLYGTAAGGGAHGAGTLWSLDTQTNTFTNLHDFTFATDGDSPVSDLVLSGKLLYGTASDGGALGGGTLWSFNTSTGIFTRLHDFDELTDGAGPGSLVQHGTMLIGHAAVGGVLDYGTLWIFDTATSQFDILHNFDRDTDGSFPIAHLVVDGYLLYGGCFFGGANGLGTGTLWAIKLPALCDGDVNLDGTVDPLDAGYVLARFGCGLGTGNAECEAADANNDGGVDPLDVGYVLARFGACE